MNNKVMFLFQIVNAELSASYMWQLQLNTAEAPSLDCHFTVTYHQTDAADRQPRKCHHSFTIENYQVMISITCAKWL